MTFTLKIHDGWGTVMVGHFQTLDEARRAFSSLCQDPWYSSDGTVRGVELVEDGEPGEDIRVDWLAFK